MKVQCDVCAEAATVFCCADEAALCDACDGRVHRANKLAGKHRRFSLLHPSPSSSSAQNPPLCDKCKKQRAFLFCKEERKLLCRECDVPIHTATEMTRRHSRFLLTGVLLSSAPVDSPAPSEEEEVVKEDEEANSSRSHNADSCSGGDAGATTASASDGSSISEYLTKTLPGWHVEDFLVDDADAGITTCSDDGLYQDEQTQIGGLLQDACQTWTGQEQLLSDVAVLADERASRERWVPLPQMPMNADWTGSKRPRVSPPCSNW